MVILDNGVAFDRQKVPVTVPKFSLPGAIGLIALAIALGSLTARGFSDNGFRLASQNVWRFASLVLFATLTVGPVSRLVPGLGRFSGLSRFFAWGFCASYGVFLAVVLLPNAFGAQATGHGGSAGATLFVLFGAGVTMMMALALTRRMAERLGEPARRALLGVAAIYFWLCYALMGLAHLSHPHRPDAFYGLSLSLMLLALLLRFADNCLTQLRRPARPSA